MAADIQVDLKVKADAASAAKAGRDMANTVKAAAGQAGGGGAGGSPFAGLRGMKAEHAVRFLNAQKAAGGGGAGGGGGGNMMAAGAAGGIAGAITTAVMNIFRAIVQALLSALRALTNAMNRAAALYARTLQSGGMPLGFMAQRAGLASIIGVGEQEVWQYGEAVNKLNGRLRFSAEINARTNRNVTSTTWALRILGEDFKALAMVAANSLSPAIRGIANSMHSIVSVVGPSLVKFFTQLFKSTVEVAVKQVTGLPAFMALRGFMRHAEGGPAPAPAVSAHRLQSSHWERMGLVIGTGGGGNPHQQTARNTKSAAQTLKEIKSFLTPRSIGQPKLAATAVNGA